MIRPELEALLEPLERFEAIRRRVVRLGDRLCDLSYANPYEGAGRGTRDALRETLNDERLLDLQYTPFGGDTRVRRAVADTLAVALGLAFRFDDVVLTPGATAALHLALRAVGAPGDEVIIPVPCWLDYPLYARVQGLRPVLVPLAGGDFGIDADAIADAVTPSTCAVLLSHPSNPAGRSYGPDALAALARALDRAEEKWGRTLTVIADEPYREFAAPGSYRSLATVWPRTLITYSFGKYHSLQGQRLGYAAVSPRHPQREAIAAELVRWTRILGFYAPTALMQRAIPRLLSLEHDLERIVHWRGHLSAELAGAGFRIVPASATPYLYVATPDGRDDFEFCHDLAMAGVLVLPAPIFHHRGYFRLSITAADSMLEQALPVLRRFGALETPSSPNASLSRR